MEISREKAIKVANQLGWTVTIDTTEWIFNKYSPAGQEFVISLASNNLTDIIIQLDFYCDNFDCSEEAYSRLDSTGHGTMGAPYSMKDVYEDMESCLVMTKELYFKLKEINK